MRARSIVLQGPQSLVFIGGLSRGVDHEHAATACVIGLEQPLRLRVTGQTSWRTTRLALIPAAQSHVLDPGGALCAVIYSEIYAPRWRAMQPGALQGLTLRDTLSPALLDALGRMQAEQSPQAVDALEDALEQTLGPPSAAQNRTQRAVNAVLSRGQAFSLKSLGSELGVSERRAQYLLIHELGVGCKRLQHWLSFRQTLRQLGQGHSLTMAALDHGFSSSSHFSHAFRAMFGVAARDALLTTQGFSLIETGW